MGSLGPFFIWLLCIAISAVMIGLFLKWDSGDTMIRVSEGFADASNISIKSCPNKSIPYITAAGDTNCCDHDVVNKQCNGNIVCSLSPNPPNGIQTCSKLYADEWNKRAKRFCPTTMPNYFGAFQRAMGNPEGCSVSVSTADGSAPQNPGQPQCKVYATQQDNRAMSDSCETVKETAFYNMCVDNVKTYGFVPKVTWGRTPEAQRNGRCDQVLCSYWNKLYKHMGEVPMTYHVSVSNCGIPPAPINYLMKSIRPSKGNMVASSYAIYSDYLLSFDITPNGMVPGWSSIIHFNANGGDCCNLGNRSPGIWLWPGNLKLHVRIGDSSSGNWGIDSDGLQLNTKSHVEVRCKGTDVRVTIDSGVTNMTQPTYRFSGTGNVYMGDPWYDPANALVENVVYKQL